MVCLFVLTKRHICYKCLINSPKNLHLHSSHRWPHGSEHHIVFLMQSPGIPGNQREAWENPNRPQADGEGQGRNGDRGAGRGAPRGNRRGAGRGRNGGRGMRQ